MQHEPVIVAASIIIAITVSIIALRIVNHLRDVRVFGQLHIKRCAALVMGMAVAFMHYSAMQGCHFFASTEPALSNPLAANIWLSHDLLIELVIAISMLVQFSILIMTLLDESKGYAMPIGQKVSFWPI